MYAIRNEANMALPIKDTPVLKGKDAERMWRIIEENETRTVTKEKLQAVNEAYAIFSPMLKKSESK
jgi:hypothetical protein